MRRRGVGPGRGPGRMAVRRMTRRRVARMSRRRRRRRRRRIILVGGAIALGTAAVYKMSKSDVDKIEASTGKSAEDLTDEELQAAMKANNIQGEELSDSDWEQVDQADAEDDAGDDDDYLDQLERLAELNKQGILTDEEFAAKKKQLLDL